MAVPRGTRLAYAVPILTLGRGKRPFTCAGAQRNAGRVEQGSTLLHRAWCGVVPGLSDHRWNRFQLHQCLLW